MKIIKTSKYDVLSRTSGYPLAGFWYSILDLKNSQYKESYKEFFNGTIDRYSWLSTVVTPNPSSGYYPNLSSFRKANTLINEGSCKVSILLPTVLQQKEVDIIFLYAIDVLRYLDYDITEGGSVPDVDYIRDLNNISMILCMTPDGSEFINQVTNIMDLKHLPKCSLVTNISEGYTNIHDSHYMSSVLDRVPFSDSKLSELAGTYRFIESVTGKEQAREKQGTSKSYELHSSMTIRTNGIVDI